MTSGRVKKYYGIKHSLNVKKRDQPIMLNFKFYKVKKPIKISIIFGVVILGVIFPIAFNQFKTPFSEGGFLGRLLLLIAWECIVAIIFVPREDGDLGYKWAMATIGYWLTSSDRKIITRYEGTSDDMGNKAKLESLIGKFEFDENHEGLLHIGRDFAYVVEVSGFANDILFDSEKHEVLGDFEMFLRNMESTVDMSLFISYSNLNLAKERNESKQILVNQKSDNLRQIAKHRMNRIALLNKMEFKIPTQWVLLTSKNFDDLVVTFKDLERKCVGGYEGSSMGKSCRLYTGKEEAEIVGSLFRP